MPSSLNALHPDTPPGPPAAPRMHPQIFAVDNHFAACRCRYQKQEEELGAFLASMGFKAEVLRRRTGGSFGWVGEKWDIAHWQAINNRWHALVAALRSACTHPRSCCRTPWAAEEGAADVVKEPPGGPARSRRASIFVGDVAAAAAAVPADDAPATVVLDLAGGKASMAKSAPASLIEARGTAVPGAWP
jgi:hypothetical protein